MFIMVNEIGCDSPGDLVIAAQMVTPAAINFMATHGRGLIRLALSRARVDELGLPPMVGDAAPRTRIAATVSIEARTGVTTGISAADRARTITVAISTRDPDELVVPGHVFPVVVRDGGVLACAGNAEAAVDIIRLAGLNPSAVLCEILDETGAVARGDQLRAFAQRHELKVGTIRDLIGYRRWHDNLVTRIGDEPLLSQYGGEWRMLRYRSAIDNSEVIVLCKGEIDPTSPTPVRIHRLSRRSDILSVPGSDFQLLHRTMMHVGEAGHGVIVLIEPEDLSVEPEVEPSSHPYSDQMIRTLGISAQILADLGIHDIVRLTNTPPPRGYGVDAFGVNIVGDHPIGFTDDQHVAGAQP